MADLPFDYSVVIAAYNSAGTVVATIRSALGQSLLPREIIVIDDGSSDGTAAAAAALDSNLVRVIPQTNAGPGSARNSGIAVAKARWIAFLDADDLWRENHAQALADLATAFPEARVIGSPVNPVTTDNNLSLVAQDAGPSALVNFFRVASSDLFFTSSVMVRRDLLFEVGGFPTVYPGEDSDLWFRLALRSPIAMTRWPTTYYVRRPSSLMGDTSRLLATYPERSVRHSMDHAVAAKDYSPLDEIVQFRRATYESYLRHAVYHGDTALIRRIAADMAARNIPLPLLDRFLMHSPASFVRAGVRAYSKFKSLLR